MIKHVKSALIAVLMVGASAPAVAATPPSDSVFYTDFLTYIQAQFSYDGATFAAFQELGLSDSALRGLSNAYGKLFLAQLQIVTDLQNKISPA